MQYLNGYLIYNRYSDYKLTITNKSTTTLLSSIVISKFDHYISQKNSGTKVRCLHKINPIVQNFAENVIYCQKCNIFAAGTQAIAMCDISI